VKAPNPKHQISNKFQLPKFQTKSFYPPTQKTAGFARGAPLFEIGIWSLFGIWNLLFGISYAIDLAIS